MGSQGPVHFRGGVVGTFWGDGAEEVSKVTLAPGDRLATFDVQGDFAFPDELPGAQHVVVHSAQGGGQAPVRVYAYADSRIEVAQTKERPHPPPSPWVGCYAFRLLEWSRVLEDSEVRLHTPLDIFRLHPHFGTEDLEQGIPVARPRLPRPEWRGRPGAHWTGHGRDSTTTPAS